MEMCTIFVRGKETEKQICVRVDKGYCWTLFCFLAASSFLSPSSSSSSRAFSSFLVPIFEKSSSYVTLTILELAM